MAFLVTGGEHSVESLMYGQQHQNTIEFCRDQMDNMSNGLSMASEAFQERARSLFDTFAGSDAMRLATAAKRAVNSLWDDDNIKELCTIAEMQWAGQTMQRYVMASPFIREKYQKQTIEGYEGSYTDFFEGDIGEDHYDYRRVMNGVMVETKPDTYYATTYYDDLYPNDRELEIEEQSDILNSWENIKAAILEDKEDPTSKWNASL